MSEGQPKRGRGRPTLEPRTAAIRARITPARLSAYQEAAARAGLTFTDWLELALDHAAEEGK
jgi:hypothetical protein